MCFASQNSVQPKLPFVSIEPLRRNNGGPPSNKCCRSIIWRCRGAWNEPQNIMSVCSYNIVSIREETKRGSRSETAGEPGARATAGHNNDTPAWGSPLKMAVHATFTARTVSCPMQQTTRRPAKLRVCRRILFFICRGINMAKT